MGHGLSHTVSMVVLSVVPILAAVTVHEVSHGWVAYLLGDPTAKLAGRLSFNPIKHLDPIGTLVFLVTRTIGWAKPVPVNPYNLRNPKVDMIWVASAGPLSNLIFAVILSFVRWFMASLSFGSPFFLRVFTPLYIMVEIGIVVNVGLAIFNLIPIPPLDGSRIVAGVLPRGLYVKYRALERYGIVIILILILSGILDKTIIPLIYAILHKLMGAMV